MAAGRKLNPSLDQDLSRTFAPLTKAEGKAFSPAEECKRILELDGGSTGAKSVVKYEKRESNRTVSNYHYWVRGPDETLSSLKYESPDKFTKEKDGVMSMYHIYSCFEMGLQWIGFRRIPCNCLSCRQQMRQPCQNGIGFKQQPRFQLVKNCKYRNYLSDKNLWYFFKLEQRTNDHGNHQLFMDEEANLFRKNIRDLIGEEVNAIVEEGNYAAVVCNNRTKNLVIILWSGLVYHGLTKRRINLCVTQFIGTPFPGHRFGTRAARLRTSKRTRCLMW